MISHNHYDHVDTAALKAYRWRAETPVVCPLGLAPVLRKLGFAQVTELDWWQQHCFDDLTVTALPAVGMHWGSIMLTPEDPFEAPDRFRRAALEQQYGEANAWIMQVGEVRTI